MSALVTGQPPSGVHGERPLQHGSHRGTRPGCGAPLRDLTTVVAQRDRTAAARSLRPTLTATRARRVLPAPAQTRPPQARSSMAFRRKSLSRNRRQARRPDHPQPRVWRSATSPACPTNKLNPCVWALRLEGCDASGIARTVTCPSAALRKGSGVPRHVSPTAGLATVKGAVGWCEQGQQRHDALATQTTFRGSRVPHVICAT